VRVRRGELTADEAARAADQHQLLRGLGGPMQPRVDHGCAPLCAGQAFALCSDGVWEQLSAQELAGFAARRDLHAAVGEALALVLTRAGDAGDNAALILVRPEHVPHAWLSRPLRWWSAWRGAGRRTHSI
jgi:serine/threonine protein phosphatase PrpC